MQNKHVRSNSRIVQGYDSFKSHENATGRNMEKILTVSNICRPRAETRTILAYGWNIPPGRLGGPSMKIPQRFLARRCIRRVFGGCVLFGTSFQEGDCPFPQGGGNLAVAIGRLPPPGRGVRSGRSRSVSTMR